MRDFAKSMMSYTWAMSVFGMQQLAHLLLPGEGRSMCEATDSFGRLTSATTEQLGGGLKATFRAGDQLQRGVMDLMFSAMTMGAWSPERMRKPQGDPSGHGPQPSYHPGAGAPASRPGTVRPPGPPPGTYPGTAGMAPSAAAVGNGRTTAGPRASASWSWGPPGSAPQQRNAEPASPPTTYQPPADSRQGWGPMP